MLLFDLNAKRISVGRAATLIVAWALVLVASVHRVSTLRRGGPQISAKTSLPLLRPLEVEERETVVFTLQRLEHDAPDVKSWLPIVTERFVGGGLNARVETVSGPKDDLVRVEKGTLVFSAAFFQSDSLIQEASLKRNLSGLMPVTAPDTAKDAPEIAISTGE